MWPFKTTEQQIGELEDKIAGKKAKLASIENTFARLGTTTSYWIQECANLAEQIATLTNRCDRLKHKQRIKENTNARNTSSMA